MISARGRLISRPDDPYRGFKRTFRAALIISLLVHPLLIALFLVHLNLQKPVVAERQSRSEIVTISSATKKADRTIARAQPRPEKPRKAQAQPQAVPQPQRIAERPVPQPVEKPIVVPTYRPPVPVAHELAKITAHGTPEPAPASARPATPAPEKPEPKRVAYAEPSTATAHTEKHERTKPVRLSEEELARLNSSFAQTIAQSRSENNPLSNVSRPVTVAEAPKHFSIDYSAVAGRLRGAEGICDPIKSWTQNGWDYYYAECNVVESDGTMARKPMPWPVRWRPRDDPWLDGSQLTRAGPMPLPPPGWHPDPAHPIDPDFLGYLRAKGYAI